MIFRGGKGGKKKLGGGPDTRKKTGRKLSKEKKRRKVNKGKNSPYEKNSVLSLEGTENKGTPKSTTFGVGQNPP